MLVKGMNSTPAHKTSVRNYRLVDTTSSYPGMDVRTIRLMNVATTGHPASLRRWVHQDPACITSGSVGAGKTARVTGRAEKAWTSAQDHIAYGPTDESGYWWGLINPA